MADIDLSALRAEVENMSEADLKQSLLDLRTKQRVNQKKNQNSDAQKAYREKRNETIKAMVELAKKKGLYNDILREANAKAEMIVAGEDSTEDETDTVQAA